MRAQDPKFDFLPCSGNTQGDQRVRLAMRRADDFPRRLGGERDSRAFGAP